MLLLVLFLYGLGRGLYDVHVNTKSSLLTMGLTATGMNPISAFGYRIGIHTNPDVQNRINSLNNTLNSFDR